MTVCIRDKWQPSAPDCRPSNMPLPVLKRVRLTHRKSSTGDRLPVAELLAAMLAYRATYYLLPLSLPAYGLIELATRRVGVSSKSEAKKYTSSSGAWP